MDDYVRARTAPSMADEELRELYRQLQTQYSRNGTTQRMFGVVEAELEARRLPLSADPGDPTPNG